MARALRSIARIPPNSFEDLRDPMANTEPKTIVLLTVECKGLRNKDTFSKSDPVCILSQKMKNGKWAEIARTETIQNDLNPKFKTKMQMDYYFEEKQELQFTIYDIDTKNAAKLSDQDFLGTIETTLGRVVGARGSSFTANLEGTKGHKYGSIRILAEEIKSGKNDMVFLSVEGRNMSTKDWMGKGDHYLSFLRQRGDGAFDEVLKTEVKKNSKDANWGQLKLNMLKLCLGNMNAPIKIQLWDWNSVSDPTFLGEVTTTLGEMANTPKTLSTKKPDGKDKEKNRGDIVITDCKIHREATFLQFIQSGLNMEVIVAIDFTASNKDPKTPQSLHYMDPHNYNQYQQAIIAVGEILEAYNSDKMFPSYGFGGKLPNGQVSHCFALNSTPENPKVARVQGILDAYCYALSNVTLWGPTNFADVIKVTHGFANNSPKGKGYYTLLILTDGVVTDYDETVEAIIAASDSPLSIIIVGVGNDDFAAMEQLDGDDKKLTSQRTGQVCKRDIVQFVPFQRYHGSGAELAKHVLKELPDQLTGYMKAHSIQPGPPIQQASEWDVPPEVVNNVAGMNLGPSPAASQGPPGYQSQAPPGYAPGPPAGGAPPPPPPPAALPPGWEELQDPSTGKLYYVNRATNQTTWERP